MSLKVLVLEDCPIQRELLVEVMNLFGHELELAATGEGALNKLQSDEFDLIMLDRQIPDMSGEKVAEKAKEQTPDTPVVLVTGDDPWTVAKKIRQNVDGFIAKPYALKDIKEILTELPNRNDGNSSHPPPSAHK